MKKNLLIVLIILINYFMTQAQAYDWGFGIGGTGYDNPAKVVSDTAGNVFIAGYFEGIIDIDPNPFLSHSLTSIGNKDFFVAKYSAEGGLIWSFSRGDTDDDAITDMDIDSEGNIYITGYYHGTIDFDPSFGAVYKTSAGDSDIFWAKFSNDGTLIWIRTLEGTGYENGGNITVNDDCIYISGYFSSTINFSPFLTTDIRTPSGTDIFITKYSKSNFYYWTRTFDSNNYDRITDLETDTSNNIYLSGNFIATFDLDPSTGVYEVTSQGGYDGFLIKLTEIGNYSWGKKFGSTHNDYAEDIFIDGSDVYLSGAFQDTFYFTIFKNGFPFLIPCTSNGGQDGIIINYNTSGSFKSRNIAGGEEDEAFYELTSDNEGNFYLLGRVSTSLTDFDFSSTGIYEMRCNSSSSQDVFVASYTPTLGIRWVKGFGSLFNDYPKSLNVQDNNNISLAIFSSGDIDMDPDEDVVSSNNHGNFDATLIKLRPYHTGTEIESFSALETSSVEVDSAYAEVKIYVNDEIDLSNISAACTLSEGAKLRESLGNNFSDTVLVTVVAEDTSITKDWTIVAFHNSDSLAELTSFLIDGYSCNSEIDSINKIITVTMMEACDISSLTPTIEFSQSASILPENGIAQNFSDTVTYTLESKDKSCTNTWNVVVKEFTTSIADNSPADFINVYPNPASGRVSIECSKGNTTYSLLSLTGQVVMSGLLAQGKNTIDLGHIKKGLYFFRLNTAEHDKVIKLIIE